MKRLFLITVCIPGIANGFQGPSSSTTNARSPLVVISNDHSRISTPLLVPRGGASSTQVSLVGPAAASVLAGSIAGAVGVGVAFPLDTLKTKAQVLGPEANGMIQTIQLIWNSEGLAGFFGTLWCRSQSFWPPFCRRMSASHEIGYFMVTPI